MRILEGDRIGKLGRIRCGCSATIFDLAGEKILLTRRSDNGQWCLPGGGIDPGESAAEACQREVWEETGLRVRLKRLTGIYSSPHRLIEYPDGNRFQIVAFNFEAEVLQGELKLSDETLEVGFIPLAQIDQLDLLTIHRERIQDALAQQSEAFFR